ncbi:hypothetical protein L1987_43496 [Smallanthus sonchifolius]|uniref:Uncharacterized protein n=1 Tax=Smallanthus sonchifolius TaxID=185202 RepID=A0ACB9GLX2_9ASTR|nr:hypothetical protein L1987_43496 [Smallanthus sonchifolius]
MKKSIFDEQTSTALKKWRMAVKNKHGGKGGKSPAPSVGNSPNASPVHPMASTINPTTRGTLHRFKTTGHFTRSVAYENTDVLDLEAEAHSPESSTRHLLGAEVDYHSDNEIKLDHSNQQEAETRNEKGFSFAKPASPLE